MAMTTAQSQLTPPLASLQYLRPYTKDDLAGLNPDESSKLFSLEALGQQYPGGMFGFGNSVDLVQNAFAQPDFINKLRGANGLLPWEKPVDPETMMNVSAGGSM